jgi:hypothetical protein
MHETPLALLTLAGGSFFWPLSCDQDSRESSDATVDHVVAPAHTYANEFLVNTPRDHQEQYTLTFVDNASFYVGLVVIPL